MFEYRLILQVGNTFINICVTMTSDSLPHMCYNDTFAFLGYEGIRKPEDTYIPFLFPIKYNTVLVIVEQFFSW